jgi:hypothetical protein
MGTIAAFFVVAATLATPAEPPPSHAEIMSHAVRLVDAPADDEDDELAPHEADPRTRDTEINCPPPTRLRCWIATAQETDGGASGGAVYCKCSR